MTRNYIENVSHHYHFFSVNSAYVLYEKRKKLFWHCTLYYFCNSGNILLKTSAHVNNAGKEGRIMDEIRKITT